MAFISSIVGSNNDLKKFIKETVEEVSGEQSEALGYVIGTVIKESAKVVDSFGGSLDEINENTKISASILQKFESVFDTMNTSLMHQSRLTHELLRVNVEQTEIANRRDQLQSVSSAAEQTIVPPVSSAPTVAGGEQIAAAGSGIFGGFLSNWLANMFSGGKGFATGLFAGGLGGFIKKGALVTIIGPWIGDVVEELISLGLDEVGISPEIRDAIKDTVGDSVTRAIQLGSIFGRKGALVGAISGPINTAFDALAEQLGADLEKEVANFAGFSITGEDITAAGSVAAGAAGVGLGGKIVNALLTAAPGMFGIVIRGITAFMSGPVGWAMLAAALGAAGVDWLRGTRATAFKDDLKPEDWAGDANQGKGDVGIGERFANSFGYTGGEINSDNERLNLLANMADEVGGQGLTPENEQFVMDSLRGYADKNNVNLENPSIDPNVIPLDDVDRIITILEAMNKADLVEKWKQQKVKFLQTGADAGAHAWGGGDRLRELDGQIADLQARANRGDAQALMQLGTMTAEREALRGQIEAQGIDPDDVKNYVPDPQSAIIPQIGPRAAGVAAVNNAGPGGTGGNLLVVQKQGDNVNMRQGDVIVNSTVSQRQAAYNTSTDPLGNVWGPGGISP